MLVNDFSRNPPHEGVTAEKILLEIHLFCLQMGGVTDEIIGNRSDHQYRQRVVRGKPGYFQ
jgi:hypothetical protein